MKRIFLLLISFILLVSVEGQVLRHGFYTAPISAEEEEPEDITDDFESYTVNTTGLHHQTTDWVSVAGNAYVGGDETNKYIYNYPTGDQTTIYRDEAYDDDQSAKITLLDVSDSYAGVVCRASTSNTMYAYWIGDGSRMISTVSGGTPNNLYTVSATPADGDTMELRVVGNTISCYYNGVLDTNLVPSGSFTNSTYSTGKPGILLYGAGTIFLDNFIAKSL